MHMYIYIYIYTRRRTGTRFSSARCGGCSTTNPERPPLSSRSRLEESKGLSEFEPTLCSSLSKINILVFCF